jgi:hypothetical protein
VYKWKFHLHHKNYGLPHIDFLEDKKCSTKLHVALPNQIVTKQVYKLINARKQSMVFHFTDFGETHNAQQL